MNQISEKELSALNDLLTGEELLIKKFQMLAENCNDSEVKAKFTEISNEHKEHFRSAYNAYRLAPCLHGHLDNLG